MVLLFMLLRRGVGPVALLPIVPALLGIVFRWGFSPILTLLLLTAVLYFRDVILHPGNSGIYRIRPKPFDLTQWILCGAFLGYVAAHYRLLGLSTPLFPPEATPPKPKKPVTPAPPAAPPAETGRRLLSPYEISWLVLSLPIWAFLAQVCWTL